MTLRKATFVVIVGIIASFSIRIFGTLFTEIFKNIAIVKSTILINSIFIVFQVIFWVIFYLEYIKNKGQKLKSACFGVIFASASISLIYFKNFFIVFEINFRFPDFIYSSGFDALTPFISSIIHLYFFIIFKQSIDGDEREQLNGAIVSMISGTSVFLLLHSIVLFNFFISNEFQWLEHMPRFFAIGTIPLLFIAVILVINFYRRFYQFLKIQENMVSD